MIWIVAILVALGAFAIGVFAFGLKKNLWTSLLATLAFGLAGYALQASPDLPGSPKSPSDARPDDGFDSVEVRRELVNSDDRSRSKLMVTADAMASARKYSDAATMYNTVTLEDRQDFEGWLAKGNALVDHANGALTPPAIYSYRQAANLRPNHPGPGYFLGVALIRQGQMMEARQVWRDTVEQAPEGSAGLPQIIDQLSRLEELLGVPEAQRFGAAPNETPVEAATETVPE